MFYFALAGHLGMSVAQLLDSMTSTEITEWKAVKHIQPFGQDVEDLRAGLAPAAVLNVDREKGSPVVNPCDFYPWHDKPAPAKPSQTDIAAQLKARLPAKRKPKQ